MIKHLLPGSGNFYKANLHCHTTISDGRKTPEEVRRIYKEQGYSVVAFTDHDVFIPHPELAEEDFLPLNGFEIEINEWNKPWEHTKSCHLCFIALDTENHIHPLWHRTDYLFANAVNYRDRVQFDPEKPDFCRSHTPECVNAAIKTARECGFFVTYNHPRWSLETLDDYGKYAGMNAMEIYNHGCYVEGYDDYAPAVYDDILRGGQRCFCLSTDDNHNWVEPLSPRWDSFGGFVMIKADRLDYKEITSALLAGNFYSSRGPEIYSLTYDTGAHTVTVECSNAEKIIYTPGTRRQQTAHACECGAQYLNRAVFDVKPDELYFRISVYDTKGLTADTNAYFIDML